MVVCGNCQVKNFIPSDLPAMETIPCTRCGHPVLMPVLMRQFELRAVIASGGMGTVYRAYDLNLEREVAIKLVKPEMAADAQVMEGFYREARAGASLNHTNIIHIYNFDEVDGQPYLVMELADQGSLDNRIEREGRVPELDVLDVGIKVASALATALKHDLLHRDLKPANILYNIEGEPKLIDFGLAAKTGVEAEAEAFVWGTPEYVAPEKINRERETFLSDMYSLAATLYHAMTGYVPFQGTVEEMVVAHVEMPLTLPNLVVPELTQPTSDAVAIAMAKNPADRFQSYDDFIMALTAARSHLLRQKFGPEDEDQKKGGWWRRNAPKE